jgi:RTA1 like protein
MPYIMQSLLILLAPALFAASIYMVLARIINLVDGEALSIIKVKFVTKVFVLGDVLSFLVQSTGWSLHSLMILFARWLQSLTSNSIRGRHARAGQKQLGFSTG